MRITSSFLQHTGEEFHNKKTRQIWRNIADFINLWIENTPKNGEYYACYIAGSVRRHISAGYITGNWLHNLHDVEIVVSLTPRLLTHLYDLKKQGAVNVTTSGQKHWVITHENIKYDIFNADKNNWGLILQLRTGPDNLPDKHSLIPRCQFNRKLMGHIKYNAPFSIADGYVWDRKTCFKKYDKQNKWTWAITPQSLMVSIPSEERWFELLGLPYINPHQRTPEILDIYFSYIDHKWGDITPYLIHPTNQPLEQPTLF